MYNVHILSLFKHCWCLAFSKFPWTMSGSQSDSCVYLLYMHNWILKLCCYIESLKPYIHNISSLMHAYMMKLLCVLLYLDGSYHTRGRDNIRYFHDDIHYWRHAKKKWKSNISQQNNKSGKFADWFVFLLSVSSRYSFFLVLYLWLFLCIFFTFPSINIKSKYAIQHSAARSILPTFNLCFI